MMIYLAIKIDPLSLKQKLYNRKILRSLSFPRYREKSNETM